MLSSIFAGRKMPDTVACPAKNGGRNETSVLRNFCSTCLYCSGHFVGAQTTRAHIDSLVCAVDNGFYLFHIRFPGSVGLPVGVRNAQAESNALAAKIALCHAGHLP